MRIAAVVLAAGAGRRIGGCKALLRVGERSFLELCVARLARPGIEPVIAVTGAEAEAVTALASGLAGVTCTHNPAHDEGMLGSLLVGLEAAERAGAEAVLMHPVDHPGVAPATVDAVVGALQAGAAIAVPSFEGRRGHPGGFAARAWEALRAARPERGARQVLSDHPDWIVHVPGDAGSVRGVDTPGDYEALFGGPVRR